MKYTIQFIRSKKIVDIKLQGRINFQLAEKYSREAIKLARENDCSKFLIDHKETSAISTDTNLFATGSELQQFGFKNTDRIAVVVNRIGSNKFAKEPQIGNISWSKFKFFSSNKLDDAIKWLSE